MNRILCAPCDAPLDEQSCDQDHLLRSAIDAYLAAGSDSVAFASAFAAWAAGAGLRYECRAGVLVSLDEEGHVLAAVASPEIGTLREIAWAIVKDAPGMAATGHAAAVRWARALLGLDGPDAPDASARRRASVHVHGWARVDGGWTCTQDYYATGDAPETGCGETWTTKTAGEGEADDQRPD